MAYDSKVVQDTQLKIGDVFAGIIHISQNITQIALDSIDGYVTPQQSDSEIRKLVAEMQLKLDELWK
jgi:hypothetical protein